MRIRSAIAALLLAVPATLAAQTDAPPIGVRTPAPGQPPQSTIMAEPVALMIAAFDADGDARVTRAECMAGVERSFRSIDTTSKGWLGYIEFADWAERWLGDRNALPSPFETDTDGDNHITLAELQAKIMTIFDRFDRNHDGVLVRAELLTLDGAHRFGGGERGGRGRGAPPRQ
jgi:hypothetical protein